MFSKMGSKILSLMLFIAMLCSVLAGVACAESVVSVEATYHSVTLGKSVNWTFAYSDQWFEKNADAYDHPIARASLGLALSGFRCKEGAPDQNVQAYLTDLGFADLTSEDYQSDTSIETIGTMMGHKQLPSGDTLLAVAICGQGYKNEWLSNFDIGDQEEHKGFSYAAQKVVQRVERYMEEHQLTNVRLWLTGYSRSAAVSNLAGAELMKKGLFNEKNAFIYTFATPNTTRNPVAYANIFNVTGKFDPVAKVPYREWGFHRHGTTLYTPSQETDSDYRQRQQRADVPFYELTGIHLWNSPVLNHHLSIIEAFLLSNIPTTADYAAHVSEHIANAWEKPDLMALRTVLEAMTSVSPDGKEVTTKERQQRVDDLLDYVFSAVLSVGDDSILMSDSFQSGEISIASPLVLEHLPDVYLAWMFSSDDPDEIFSDKTQYMHLVVGGDADVNLFDQKGGFVLSLDAEGNLSRTTENERYLKRIRPVEDRPMIAAMNADEKNVFMLPKDQGFPFTMIANSEDELIYYGVQYDIRQSAPTMTSYHLINMEPGKEYLGFSLTPNGQAIMNAEESLYGDSDEIGQAFEANELLSVTDADLLAGLNPMQVSVRSTLRVVLIIAAVLLIVLILLLVFITRLSVRAVRKVKRKGGKKSA